MSGTHTMYETLVMREIPNRIGPRSFKWFGGTLPLQMANLDIMGDALIHMEH